MFELFKKRRRKKITARPFPDIWLRMIEKRVPYYRLLSDEEKRRLLTHVKIFLAEKQFEGCGGIQVNDEMRVIIAAQACVLLLDRPADYYPNVGSIVIYPEAYIAPTRQHLPGDVVSEGHEVRVGESWDMGTVVLTWEEVQDDTPDVDDGYNVVFHEFAHQLQGDAWSAILDREFQQLSRDTEEGYETLLDSYGATDPAEFFAVVTEVFFEMPFELKEEHPQLYEEFKKFYRQDPLERYRH